LPGNDVLRVRSQKSSVSLLEGIKRKRGGAEAYSIKVQKRTKTGVGPQNYYTTRGEIKRK